MVVGADNPGDRCAQRRGHMVCADHDGDRRPITALARRPASDRRGPQRRQILDEGQRFGGADHVRPAADQQLVRAVRRKQRNRGLELRHEVGQIRQLGVVARVAVDDRA